MKGKVFSLILAFAVVLAMIPTFAFAAVDPVTVHATKTVTERYSSGLNITGIEPTSSNPNVVTVKKTNSGLTFTSSGMVYFVEISFTGVSAGTATVTLSGTEIPVTVTGHRAGNTVQTKDPNCIEAGEKSTICAECDTVLSTTSVPAIGANGHIEAAQHKVENIEEPSYTKEGSYTRVAYCGICNAVLSRSFETVPKYVLAKTSITSLKKADVGQMTLKWKKVSKASGYQIKYSTSSKFTSSKTVTVKGKSTLTKTISKLKSGKKYYVKMRTYKTENSKKAYSAWTTVKSVTVK